MALPLHALCVVQTVSLHKLVDAMPTAVDKDSNLRLPKDSLPSMYLTLTSYSYDFLVASCQDRSCAEHTPPTGSSGSSI